MNAGVAMLNRVHSVLDLRVCYVLVIGGMALIGALKAAGNMPHLMSKVGRSTEASLSVQVDPARRIDRAWSQRVKLHMMQLQYDEAIAQYEEAIRMMKKGSIRRSSNMMSSKC